MSTASEDVDGAAAMWAAIRNLRALSQDEQAAFDAWISADSRHLGAYGRAEAALCRFERLSSATLGPAPSIGPARIGVMRRRVLLAGSAAACLAAGFVGVTKVGGDAREERFSTEIGQIREVVLDDGSVVSLNTNSEIVARLTRHARNISLIRGEALFDVAKNKHRPFVVSAGDARVRAVGTSFTVSRLPQGPVQVLVREGVVELHRVDAVKAKPVRASADIRAIIAPYTPITITPVPAEQLERDLAWQTGRIAFDNQTLADAAAEFSRYSEVRIVVDPTVSHRTVTGLFAANDPIGFAKAAASVLKLRTQTSGGEVRITE
jgi:transmembrane sensor